MAKSCHVAEQTKRHHLTCFYTNANNLQNKINELKGRIDDFKPDIVGITEVWMKEKLIIQGYHPAFRYDRDEGRRGGGVLLLVKDCHVVVECTDFHGGDFEESVWCIIKTSDSAKLLVGIC